MQINSTRRLTLREPNLYHFVMDIAWFGLALATTTRFLSIYAIHLDATASQLTWMTALPALMLLIASTASGWWRGKHRNTQRAVFWPAFGFRLSFFLLVFTPFLPAQWQPWWIIAVMTLTAVPQGIAGVIFLGLMRESVSVDCWMILNSRRQMAMNGTIAIGAVLAGLWLEKVVFPLNYQVMFGAAFVATLISLWHVTRVSPLFEFDAPSASTFDRSLWQSNHVHQLISLVLLTHVPFFLIYPFVPLHLVNSLGASEGFIALFGLVELMGGVFIAAIAAHWIIQLGVRSAMAYGMLGTGIAVLMIAIAETPWVTLPAALLLGGAWVLVGITILGIIIDEVHPENTIAYNTIFMQAIGLATFVGPVLGNLLVSANLDLVTVLLIGACTRIIASVVIHNYFRYPSPKHITQVRGPIADEHP